MNGGSPSLDSGPPMSPPPSGFELAFRAQPDPAYLLDEKGCILACSDAGAAVLGMPAELLTGQPGPA